jgi:hypothetical protein
MSGTVSMIAEMSESMRSPRFVDKPPEYEFIKVFARIRPRNGKAYINEGLRDSSPQREECVNSPTAKSSRLSFPLRDKNLRSSTSLVPRPPTSRDSTPTKLSKTQPQHHRATSLSSTAMSPLLKRSPQSKNSTPSTSESKLMSRSAGNTPTRLHSPSVSNKTSHRDLSPNVLSPSKLLADSPCKLADGAVLCSEGKAPTCVSVQDEKTLKLLSLSRCHCETCFIKGSSKSAAAASRSGSIDHHNYSSKAQKCFTLDSVFTERDSQQDIYTTAVKGYISTLFQGINSTVLLCGPPGSGKTYTMRGNKANPGIIPNVMSDIFAQIEKLNIDCKRREVSAEISYVELHNNFFRNLLKDKGAKLLSKTSIHEDSMECEFPTWNAAAKRIPVSSAQEAMTAIDEGYRQRTKRSSIGGSVGDESATNK